MVKITLLAVVFFLTIAIFRPTSAHADNMTACGAVLCLAGSGGAGCSSYLNAFYSIKVWHHGVFSPWRTLDARSGFLNQCSSAPEGLRSSLLSQFGSSW